MKKNYKEILRLALCKYQNASRRMLIQNQLLTSAEYVKESILKGCDCDYSDVFSDWMASIDSLESAAAAILADE